MNTLCFFMNRNTARVAAKSYSACLWQYLSHWGGGNARRSPSMFSNSSHRARMPPSTPSCANQRRVHSTGVPSLRLRCLLPQSPSQSFKPRRCDHACQPRTRPRATPPPSPRDAPDAREPAPCSPRSAGRFLAFVMGTSRVEHGRGTPPRLVVRRALALHLESCLPSVLALLLRRRDELVSPGSMAPTIHELVLAPPDTPHCLRQRRRVPKLHQQRHMVTYNPSGDQLGVPALLHRRATCDDLRPTGNNA